MNTYEDGFSWGEEVMNTMIQSGINAKYIRGLIPVFPKGSVDSYMGFIMGTTGNAVYGAAATEKKKSATQISGNPSQLSREEIDDIIARTYLEKSR
jgi:hypothetical protein